MPLTLRSRLTAWALPVTAAFTISCGPGQVQSQVLDPGSVTVNGAVLSLDGLPTVGAALSRTSTHIPSGQLLSVVHRHAVGSDQQPGTVLVNGTASDVDAALHDGDHLVTVAGPDAVEATRTALEPAAPARIATLDVGGRPAMAEVTRGVVSGEVVSHHLVSRAVRGHLSAPREIALTFDDGPNPAWTPQVLALLARAHVHATFCLIGRQAKQYPGLVRAIVAQGHTLCNHTWDHDEGLPKRTPDQIRGEMTRAQRAIIDASGGVVPRLYRAPGGAWSPQVEQISRSLGMTPLKWNVDPRDWNRPGADVILGVTLATVRPGAIVLFHDGGGRRDQTVAALAALLTRLPQGGFTYGIPQP